MRFIVTVLMLTAVSTASSYAGELETYRVGYNNWIGYIALFVAEEKGFFEEEGIKVVKTSFSAPGDGLKPLLLGNLDAHFTTVDSVVIALDKSPGNLKVVYLTDTSAGADAIIAKTEIKSAKDLKGKKVAATLGECNHLLLVKALESVGLTEADVNLVSMNPDDSGAAFAAGQLDAAATWEPWISQVQGEKKGHVIYSTKDAPNLILDCVAISAKTASKKASATKAFLRALNKANELAMTHPAEAAALATKALEMPPADIEVMLKQVILYGVAENIKQLEGGALAPTAELAAFFKSVDANESIVDEKTVFDSQYIKP